MFFACETKSATHGALVCHRSATSGRSLEKSEVLLTRRKKRIHIVKLFGGFKPIRAPTPKREEKPDDAIHSLVADRARDGNIQQHHLLAHASDRSLQASSLQTRSSELRPHLWLTSVRPQARWSQSGWDKLRARCVFAI